jgi:hypothetical protein
VGDVGKRLAPIPAFDRLAPLVRGELRFPSHFHAARLRPLTDLACAGRGYKPFICHPAIRSISAAPVSFETRSRCEIQDICIEIRGLKTLRFFDADF